MGLFDIFKKKEENPVEAVPAAKSLTVSFNNKMPMPFEDPEYRSILVMFTGEITVSAKDPTMDIESRSEMIRCTVESAVGPALAKRSFCFREFEGQSEDIGRDVAEALMEYNVESFKLLSFEPDKMSMEAIERQDMMKKMLDPANMANMMPKL